MAREIKIYSTRDQIKDFKDSVLWKDIKRELRSWKKGFDVELKGMVDDIADNPNISTASVLTHLGDLNGRVKAVDYLLSVPDIFLQILEEEK